MAAWILDRTAPAARRAIGVDKPLARDFYRTIERARTDRPDRGWQRLSDVASLAPGDLFAWLKPEMFKERANTGHVGFALGKPCATRALRALAGAHRRRDDRASRRRFAAARRRGWLRHRDDRIPGRRRGAPRAYGWYGEAQDPATFVPTESCLAACSDETARAADRGAGRRGLRAARVPQATALRALSGSAPPGGPGVRFVYELRPDHAPEPGDSRGGTGWPHRGGAETARRQPDGRGRGATSGSGPSSRCSCPRGLRRCTRRFAASPACRAASQGIPARRQR